MKLSFEVFIGFYLLQRGDEIFVHIISHVKALRMGCFLLFIDKGQNRIFCLDYKAMNKCGVLTLQRLSNTSLSN